MNKPAPTIDTFCYQKYHPIENRSLTPAELKRITTFPDDFKFLSFNDAWIRMGNSVPPNLMMNIANYVKSIIESESK